MLARVFEELASARNDMVQSLIKMCRIPAYHPSSGGEGEAEKTRYLEGLIKELGLKYRMYRAVDRTVPSGYRPNLIVYPDEFPREGEKRVWLVAHTDIVPPGNIAEWNRPPFEPYVRNGKVYGRGTEDNGQPIVSSLYSLWALKKEGIHANAGIVLVADEETGSKKGIRHLISKGIFKKDDLILVPDWGTPSGDSIEIAEKSILWVKIITEGRQVHASTPHKGINAFRAASHLLTMIDKALHERFGSRNALFDFPYATFEPTKKEANVPNINTVPGRDVFYFDCRVLPEYSLDDVIAMMEDQIALLKRERNVKVRMEFVQKERSPPSSENSDIVQRLKKALKEVRGIKAKAVGIGGGTCAAYFRKIGIDVAVWQTCEGTAHMVNEYMKVKNMTDDAKIFARVFAE